MRRLSFLNSRGPHNHLHPRFNHPAAEALRLYFSMETQLAVRSPFTTRIHMTASRSDFVRRHEGVQMGVQQIFPIVPSRNLRGLTAKFESLRLRHDE
jgi:hypothetical protein